MNKSIILFDGVWNLCNGAVQFLINRDSQDQFRFASLQSDLGRKVMQQLNNKNIDSIVLIESGRIYTTSTAALRIAKHLPAPWNYLYLLRLLPRPLRDQAYTCIAHHRYQWFGRQDTCMLPTPENERKFLMKSN